MLLYHSCFLSVFLCRFSILLFPWYSQLALNNSSLALLFICNFKLFRLQVVRDLEQLCIPLVINPPPIASHDVNGYNGYNWG